MKGKRKTSLNSNVDKLSTLSGRVEECYVIIVTKKPKAAISLGIVRHENKLKLPLTILNETLNTPGTNVVEYLNSSVELENEKNKKKKKQNKIAKIRQRRGETKIQKLKKMYLPAE